MCKWKIGRFCPTAWVSTSSAASASLRWSAATLRVVQDVPPFVTIDGITGCVVGLNLVGLRRAGFKSSEVVQLKAAYRLIYRRTMKWTEMLEQLKAEFPAGPAAAFFEFLVQGKRGFVQERRMPAGATIKLRDNIDAEAAEALAEVTTTQAARRFKAS